MYEEEGLDVATDGKAWQWGVASVLALALVIPLLPLIVAFMVRDRLRQPTGAPSGAPSRRKNEAADRDGSA